MKITLAVDGSKYGKWATGWLGRLPFAEVPRVTALHVLDVASLSAPFMVQPVIAGSAHFLQQEIARMERLSKKVAAETTASLAALNLHAKMTIARGAVTQTILQRAPGPQGLIVMGGRGLTAIDRFMLGSVSTHVTTHARCSVLVVKQPPRPISRVLVAIDGSKSSERSLKFLMREFKPARNGGVPEILVVHVLPFLQYPEFKEAGRVIVSEAVKKLKKAGFQTTECVQLGNPADQIMKVAEHQKADMIVTGATGLGAISRLLLGSVSRRIVQHSACSVLVVRS
jgi:nucleotide-binding universal stress UspA family protein